MVECIHFKFLVKNFKTQFKENFIWQRTIPFINSKTFLPTTQKFYKF